MVAVTPEFGLPAIAAALLPVTVMALATAQVVGLLHWAAQFTVVEPVSAASQAWVVVLVLTARR